MADTVKRKYQRHKSNSQQRGIGFHLTYEEWLGLWMQLDENGVPYLENRGKGIGKYVMMRYGDTGPYELGNVRIGLDTDNIRETKFSEERKRKISEALKGKKHEHGNKIAEALIGQKHSEERKRKIGDSLRGRKRGPYKKLKKCVQTQKRCYNNPIATKLKEIKMEYEIIADRETPIHEVWYNGECVFKGYYDECEEFIKEMTEEL